MRLKYYIKSKNRVVGAGEAKIEESWYHDWLMSLIGTDVDNDLIFFFVEDTTDIWPVQLTTDILDVVIKVQDWVGIENAKAYSFDCPLCNFRVFPDLSVTYVEATAVNHLKNLHNVDINKKIRIIYSNIGSSNDTQGDRDRRGDPRGGLHDRTRSLNLG